MYILPWFWLCWKMVWWESQGKFQSLWRRKIEHKQLQDKLPDISRSKGNQTMKFGKLIENNMRNIFLQKSCRKQGRETSSRNLFVFWKSLIWCQSKSCAPQSRYILITLALGIHKYNLHKTLDCWSRDMLNCNFLHKGLRPISPPHFQYDFSGKIFLELYSIKLPNFFFWLSLGLEMLDNKCNVNTCDPVCGVTNFVIDLSFLIKLFLYMTK